ncbi:hypothetical protein [Geodermatophilus sp. SYSU D00079]
MADPALRPGACDIAADRAATPGLVADLAAAGVAAEVRDVGHEFQRGARSLLQPTRG